MQKEIKRIEKQRIYFESLLEQLNKTQDTEKKLEFACAAATYATYCHTGYYYSKILEKFFCDYAKSLSSIQKEVNVKQNSFLHVLTAAYKYGGHTRVVEKWIEQSPENQLHSVIIVDQPQEPLPQKLETAVKDKAGELILLDSDKTLKDKALELRKIASGYQYIVLHIHMDDPTALIAFGTEEFHRPVIMFNHADHMFWLGVSVADQLANLREIQNKITNEKRCIEHSYCLCVPIETNINKTRDKSESKRKLGLDEHKKLILSVGGTHKYKPIGEKSFANILYKITEQNPDAEVILIGPEQKEKQWKKAYINSNGKIRAIGNVNYNEGYFDYLNAADIILDSWPMSGGTVMLDAITCNRPVLTLQNPIGQFDYIVKSKAFCQDEKELCEKAKNILYNEEAENELLTELKKNLEEDHSPKNWKKKLEKFIEITPKTHQLKDFSNETENKDIDDAAIVLNYIYNKNFMKNSLFKRAVSYLKYLFYKYINKKPNMAMKYLKKYHLTY